jgi:hypothetical protein
VDGCQGQGMLEKSSSGSRGSHWAIALIMMMMIYLLECNRHSIEAYIYIYIYGQDGGFYIFIVI